MFTQFAQIFALLAAAAICAQAAPTQAAPPAVVVQVSAAKKVTTVEAGGKTRVVWEPVGNAQASVVPGDILRYKVIGSNHLPRALRSFVLTQPVPQGTEYVPQSAAVISGGEATLTISIDGGATFSPKPMIEVKSAGGSVRREPAPASQYTHLRWTFTSDLAAESSVSAGSEMRVR